MNINTTAGIKLAAISAIMLAAFLGMAPPAQAKKDKAQDANWSEWSAIGAGYVARRREPPKMNLPPAERRLAGTQPHNANKKSKRENKNKDNQPKAIASTVLSTTNVAALKNERAATRFKELWLYTTEEGLHRVSVAEIAEQTRQTEKKIRKQASRGKLSLTNGDQTVAWHFDDESDAIWFAATAYDSFHTDADAYHFTLQNKSALPMAPSDYAAPALPGIDTPFADTLHFEEEPDFQFSVGSVAAEPDADYWFWDYLYGGFKDQIEVTLRVPDPAPSGTAKMRIALRGWTDLEYGDEHEVSASLNGTDIGSSIIWDGFEAAELELEFDQGLLSPSGDNTLKLHNSYAPGSHPGQFLDAIDITYSRMPQADGGSLWLHAVSGGTQRVGGFSSDQLVVVESPRGNAVLRDDALLESDGLGGWSVTFNAADGADYLVAERGSAYLASVAPDYPSSLKKHNNAADYLIIAPREFTQTAQALADYRGNRFGQVRLAWVDDIYDEFSAGREDPAAITAFMRLVQEKWQLSPSVVMIVGKGSLDHKDRMGYADSFVPVSLVSTPWAVAASDDKLLANDSQIHTGFAIGRLPITNDQEGMAYLDKLIAHESGAYGNERYQAVVVADNPDEAGDFHANSQLLAEQLLDSAGFDRVSRLYHPQDAVRTELILSSTWEAGYVSYDGHGSSGQVGNGTEKFITASDADLLQNSVYPVFTALTCASGDYSLPGTRSLAGSLVLNPSGGAIAALAPTGLSLDEDAQHLGTAFVDSLFGGLNTIGDALLDSKLQTAGLINDFMPLVYSIVGEPAVYAR